MSYDAERVVWWRDDIPQQPFYHATNPPCNHSSMQPIYHGWQRDGRTDCWHDDSVGCGQTCWARDKSVIATGWRRGSTSATSDSIFCRNASVTLCCSAKALSSSDLCRSSSCTSFGSQSEGGLEVITWGVKTGAWIKAGVNWAYRRHDGRFMHQFESSNEFDN